METLLKTYMVKVEWLNETIFKRKTLPHCRSLVEPRNEKQSKSEVERLSYKISMYYRNLPMCLPLRIGEDRLEQKT